MYESADFFFFIRKIGFGVYKKTYIFAPQLSAGAIAQLVEQRTENPCVPGSIPGGTTALEEIRGLFLWGYYSFNESWSSCLNISFSSIIWS